MRNLALVCGTAALIGSSALKAQDNIVDTADILVWRSGISQSATECVSFLINLEVGSHLGAGLASFRLVFSNSAGNEIGEYGNSSLVVGGFEAPTLCVDNSELWVNGQKLGNAQLDTNGRVAYLVSLHLLSSITDRITGLNVPISRNAEVKLTVVVFDLESGATTAVFGGGSPLRLFKAPSGGAFEDL